MADEQPISELLKLTLEKRVKAIRAAFVVFGWEAGRVKRDGMTRFGTITISGPVYAVVDPRENTVTFKFGTQEPVVLSIKGEMFHIERAIQTKMKPPAVKKVYPTIKAGKHMIYVDYENNSKFGIIVADENGNPLAFEPMEFTREQLREVANEINNLLELCEARDEA